MPMDGVVVVDVVVVVVVEVVVDVVVVVVVEVVVDVDVEGDGYSQQSSQLFWPPGSMPHPQLSVPQTRGPAHSPSSSQSPSPSPHGP